MKKKKIKKLLNKMKNHLKSSEKKHSLYIEENQKMMEELREFIQDTLDKMYKK